MGDGAREAGWRRLGVKRGCSGMRRGSRFEAARWRVMRGRERGSGCSSGSLIVESSGSGPSVMEGSGEDEDGAGDGDECSSSKEVKVEVVSGTVMVPDNVEEVNSEVSDETEGLGEEEDTDDKAEVEVEFEAVSETGIVPNCGVVSKVVLGLIGAVVSGVGR